jgi:hypothetical protein
MKSLGRGSISLFLAPQRPRIKALQDDRLVNDLHTFNTIFLKDLFLGHLFGGEAQSCLSWWEQGERRKEGTEENRVCSSSPRPEQFSSSPHLHTPICESKDSGFKTCGFQSWLCTNTGNWVSSSWDSSQWQPHRPGGRIE